MKMTIWAKREALEGRAAREHVPVSDTEGRVTCEEVCAHARRFACESLHDDVHPLLKLPRLLQVGVAELRGVLADAALLSSSG